MESADSKRKSGRMERCTAQSISPSVINELVDGSSRILEEILKEVNTLIASEKDSARKQSLVKIRVNAMKERVNFRVLSRHIASVTESATPKTVLDVTVDEGSSGDFKKDFENLPEKLVEKFARDLPGWCLHVERPEILHLGHCRYDSVDREFFCDAVVSLLQRPDSIDRVFVNVLFLDPDTNDVARKNQRFSFPIQDILATIVPLLKSTEGKWTQNSRRRLAEAAAREAPAAREAAAAADPSSPSSVVHVKTELMEELSSTGDEHQHLESPFPTPLPPASKPRSATIRSDTSIATQSDSQAVIVKGKRRRTSRLSKETIREALTDFDDDIMDEDEVVEDPITHMQFVKFREERDKDKDFVPAPTHGPDGLPIVHEEDILGKCVRCDEYLKIRPALTHMADKHADDIVNRLMCPICTQVPLTSSMEDHLRRKHSDPDLWIDEMFTCPSCDRAFKAKHLLDEHVINVHKPDEKKFLCEQCELKFASDRLLKNHVKKKHEVREDGQPRLSRKKMLYVCHICAREFSKPDHLINHELSFHGSPEDYKFKCPQCEKKFGSIKRLQCHLETHVTERKYECPTCNKCFKTKHNLGQHKHSHGPPQYECEVCGSKFSFNTSLLAHVRAIHGLKLAAPKEPVSEESMDAPFSEESME